MAWTKVRRHSAGVSEEARAGRFRVSLDEKAWLREGNVTRVALEKISKLTGYIQPTSGGPHFIRQRPKTLSSLNELHLPFLDEAYDQREGASSPPEDVQHVGTDPEFPAPTSEYLGSSSRYVKLDFTTPSRHLLLGSGCSNCRASASSSAWASGIRPALRASVSSGLCPEKSGPGRGN